MATGGQLTATKSSQTSEPKPELSFLLKALGFTTEAIDSVQPPPWDTTHLLSRSYTLIELFPASENASPLQPDPLDAATASESEWQLSSMPSFTEEQLSSWYEAIMRDESFCPWSATNALFASKYDAGEIAEEDLEEWRQLYAHFKGTTDLSMLFGYGDEINRIGDFLNELVLWFIAADYRWGFQQTEGKLEF